MLTKQTIEEFRTIFAKETGETISNTRATEMASNLISLMDVVYRPIPKAQPTGLEEDKDDTAH